MILTENELFAQFVLLSGSKIYFFWQKYTSQTKCFFGSLSNWSLCKYFQVKAVVVVPTDQEFRRRVSAREALEGKEVPDAAVLNMKANFVLPDFEETFFSGVFYTELSPEDTHAIVIQYNAEAISLGQNPTSAVSKKGIPSS